MAKLVAGKEQNCGHQGLRGWESGELLINRYKLSVTKGLEICCTTLYCSVHLKIC